MRFNTSDKDQNSRDAQAWQFVPQNGGLVIYCFPVLMVLSPPSHVVLAWMYSQFISRMMRLHSTPSVKIGTERLEVHGLFERFWASLLIEHSTRHKSLCCDLYLKSGVCSFLDDNLPIWYRMCTARPAWHGPGPSWLRAVKVVWFIAPPPPPLLLTFQIWATSECTQMVSKYVEQADRVVLAETTSVSSLISTKSNLLLLLLCLVKVRFYVYSWESLKS